MMDNAQLVNIKWTNSNKKYFINKGYQYTKNGDTFYVRVEDLSVGSKKEIIYYCDFCFITYWSELSRNSANARKICKLAAKS